MKLVCYFTCSGYTKKFAERISERVGADLFEIKPAIEYTNEDLDYTNSNSRCVKEMSDETSRPEVKELINIDKYDVIYVGYPIWGGKAPTIINTFLESYNLEGKTIIPFGTYHSSGIGESDKYLIPSVRGAKYINAIGFRMDSLESVDTMEIYENND